MVQYRIFQGLRELARAGYLAHLPLRQSVNHSDLTCYFKNLNENVKPIQYLFIKWIHDNFIKKLGLGGPPQYLCTDALTS